MITKYFVEIIAPDQKMIIDLQKFELDLFQTSVKTNTEKKEFSIEGLITLDDVNKLTQSGYKVLVKKEAPKRTPAVDETSSFQNWKMMAEKSLRSTTISRKEEQKEKERKITREASFMLSFPGYLTAEVIEATLQYMSTLYLDITELISLPEKTHEGRTCRTIKISKKSATPKMIYSFLVECMLVKF
jgi:hypothetical protein